MRSSNPGIPTIQICQLPGIGACEGFAFEEGIDFLKIIVMEQDIVVSACRRIHDRVWKVAKTIVVQWVRVQRGEMIHPHAICAKQAADLTHERSTPAMANQVQRQLGDGMAAQFRNKIGLHENRSEESGDLKSAGAVVRDLPPIELDEDLSGIGSGGQGA